jgi:hypothetical protein
MAALPTAVKLHIITALACLESPAKVATSVKEQFGLVLSRQRIEAWHPERVAGAKLDAKWRDIFEGTRRRFFAELDNIPIAHRSYRLRQLGRLAQQAEDMGNLALVLQMFEQAAKEVGDVYANRRVEAPKGLCSDDSDWPSAPSYALTGGWRRNRRSG